MVAARDVGKTVASAMVWVAMRPPLWRLSPEGALRVLTGALLATPYVMMAVVMWERFGPWSTTLVMSLAFALREAVRTLSTGRDDGSWTAAEHIARQDNLDPLSARLLVDVQMSHPTRDWLAANAFLDSHAHDTMSRDELLDLIETAPPRERKVLHALYAPVEEE